MTELTLEQVEREIERLMEERAKLRAEQRKLQRTRGELAARDQVARRLKNWSEEEIEALSQVTLDIKTGDLHKKPSPWANWWKRFGI